MTGMRHVHIRAVMPFPYLENIWISYPIPAIITLP
jgi:hypothetical protein